MIHLQELYKLGADVYTQGTIKHGRQIRAYYYKLWNGITPEKLQEVQQVFPAAYMAKTRAQYAPEIVSNVLLIPSKAQIKRDKVTARDTGNSVSGLTTKGAY